MPISVADTSINHMSTIAGSLMIIFRIRMISTVDRRVERRF